MNFASYADFNINILEEPAHYNITILPKHIKSDVQSTIEKFIKGDDLPLVLSNRLKEVISFMNSQDRGGELENFREIGAKLDLLRRESLRESYQDIPQMVEILSI